MFLSHPDVCSPIRETLEIFSLDWRRPRFSGLYAALLGRQRHLFDQWHLAPRRPISASAQQYIDRTLYRWKLKTLEDGDMRFKAQDVVYSPEEVAGARLATKNNNGLIFLPDLWLAMYPDATFFALVRHPVPLYESHKRRGIADSPEEFAAFYNKMVARMRADEGQVLAYHLVRFEDLLREPVAQMQRLYQQADLDWHKIAKVRFKAKAHMQADGRHETAFDLGRHYWFLPEEAGRILDPRVNRYQRQQLEPEEEALVLQLTAANRAYLDYD